MQITKTLYVTKRSQWRAWLKKNYKKEKEIWLIFYNKASNKPRLPYNDAVEEALCFGWIDSIVKKIDERTLAQRYSPRRKGSPMSQLNMERVRLMIKQNKMTPAGLDHFHDNDTSEEIKIKPDILKKLKSDKEVWKNFNNFPDHYKRVRIAGIEGYRENPKMFKTRLNNFIKKTKKNIRYGQMT